MRSVSVIKALVLSASLVALPAHAAESSPELVQAWRAEASDLHTRLSALQGQRIPDIMRVEIARFGRVANRLSKAETSGEALPSDLVCIFRGMSEEAEAQLTALSNAGTDEERATARKRLLSMLSDAVIVGEAAEIALTGDETAIEMKLETEGNCMAAEPLRQRLRVN